jgi:hypothetical protein
MRVSGELVGAMRSLLKHLLLKLIILKTRSPQTKTSEHDGAKDRIGMNGVTYFVGCDGGVTPDGGCERGCDDTEEKCSTPNSEAFREETNANIEIKGPRPALLRQPENKWNACPGPWSPQPMPLPMSCFHAARWPVA